MSLRKAVRIVRVAVATSALLVAGAVLPSSGPIGSEAQAASFRHLTLQRTAPEADAAVAGPVQEIRLFFSEAPQMAGTSVTLVNSSESPVAATVAAADRADAKQVFIRPETPLASGTYVVHWRTLAEDGHAMNGDFGFSVNAE
jgi:methionine-rich copper-binding protein CopC